MRLQDVFQTLARHAHLPQYPAALWRIFRAARRLLKLLKGDAAPFPFQQMDEPIQFPVAISLSAAYDQPLIRQIAAGQNT